MRFPELKELNTPRLVLRKLTMTDAPLYYSRIASRSEVTRYMLWNAHTQLSETEAVIQMVQNRYAAGLCYRWCIALAEDDSPIGVIELLRFDEAAESCSFAYMIGADFWGKGYGTEALRATLQFAFEDMEVQTVTADHMAENPASGAVMRKAGMSFCRRIPEKYIKLGQAMDACEYSITRIDWLQQKEIR